MDLLSKDNAKFKKQNELLTEMITKFLSGEYAKDQLSQEFQLLIDKGKKSEYSDHGKQ